MGTLSHSLSIRLIVIHSFEGISIALVIHSFDPSLREGGKTVASGQLPVASETLRID